MKNPASLSIAAGILFLSCSLAAFTGCPNISGSGGVEGPTHMLKEDACIYLYKGDQWPHNRQLTNYVARQCRGNPLAFEGEANVAVLKKGAEVQDRGPMPLQIPGPEGAKTVSVRYVCIESGELKGALGWISDEYLEKK
ncbi:MAG: hypothetical protein E3J72_14385 [Planctomycetota bacterium]|nr:MAG: hypothetical protein E3J72_14385 [Planctomycetota bacterium]